jgi:hypothetical protein
MEIIINILLWFLGLYFTIGLVFGIYFLFIGAEKIDPVVKESRWTVRILFLPGAIGMWIFLILKLLRKS